MIQTSFSQGLTSFDLHAVNIGSQRCKSNHSYGPAVRRNILLHYVYEGTGCFEAEGKTHVLTPGQAFVIFPDQTTYYKADAENPWYYSWVEIAGIAAADIFSGLGIGIESPIIRDIPPFNMGTALSELFHASVNGGSVFKLTGLLWHFIDSMAECCNPLRVPLKRLYIEKSLEYIETHYWRRTNVNELAEYIGINRSYLNRLFKKHTGLSPQQYMVDHRMKIAAELLRRRNLTVGDVGRSVGYDDQMVFSKAFKKYWGVPPSQWRRMNSQT